MANICGNYLQVVTKDMLENQVGLGTRGGGATTNSPDATTLKLSVKTPGP